MIRLGNTGLSDPDEPYYAVPAHEMIESGTWLVPVFRGKPWFDKPILFYWMVLAGFLVFGVTETGARMGSVLAGASGVLVVYALGRRVCRHERGALGAGIILATSLEYVILARAAVTDMTLTLFVTLGMLAVAECLEEGRPRQAALAGVAFGLATLTKGPVAVLVPGCALLVYLVVARRTDALRWRLIASALAGFVLSAGPWYVYMGARYPDLLVGTFLGQENMGRFLAAEHRAFPFYYVAVLLAGLLPWSGGLPVALWRSLRPSTWLAERRPGGRPGPLFLVCWFGAVIGIFSLSASKLPSYILPAFPPAALLLGDFWAETLVPEAWPQRPGATRLSAWLGVLITAGVVVTFSLLLRRTALEAARAPVLAAGAFLLAGALASVAAVRRCSWRAMFALQGCAAAAAVLCVCLYALPAVEEFDSTRPLVRALRAQGLESTILGVYRAKDVSLDFYLGRALPVIHDRGELRRRVAAEPGGAWIVLTRDLGKIRGDAALTVTPLLERPCRSIVRLDPARLGLGDGP
jgi:4-amino-4-deoxy-L-arabinose transferase-like glycosyltransferase